MLGFLSLDCVSEVFSYMAGCIPQIGAGARLTMVMSSRSALFLGRVCVCVCVHLLNCT